MWRFFFAGKIFWTWIFGKSTRILERKKILEVMKMAEKIFDHEAMSDDELEQIAGGMGYVYFAQGEQNGVSGYHIMITMNPYNTQS